jgi:uncharacterized protein
MRLAVPFVVVALAASPALAQALQAPDPPVVVSQAEAIIRRAPDRARVLISTEVRDGKAAEARRKSAEAMTAVQAALKAVGLASDAVRTSGFTLSPEMEYGGGKPSVRNYVVRNQIDVRVDDLDKLADVIDAANSPKNVAIVVGNPRYELKDREAAELEAVTAAVRLARARAQAMAAGTGQVLGTVVRIQQGSVYTTAAPIAPPPPAQPRALLMAGAAGRGGGGGGEPIVETPITPGELEVRAHVTLTVAIK